MYFSVIFRYQAPSGQDGQISSYLSHQVNVGLSLNWSETGGAYGAIYLLFRVLRPTQVS